MNKLSPYNQRIIFTNTDYGRRQLKEVLGNLLVGLIISTDKIWLVSPWLTDYDLLDNRTGNWNAIDPSWDNRFVTFTDLLISLVKSGCHLNVVTTNIEINRPFINKLSTSLNMYENFQIIYSENLHIKGLLTDHFFINGSMNFTYRGANINEEQVPINIDKETILEAKLEFEGRYE